MWCCVVVFLCFRQIYAQNSMGVESELRGEVHNEEVPWVLRKGRNTLHTMCGGKSNVKKFFTTITDSFAVQVKSGSLARPTNLACVHHMSFYFQFQFHPISTNLERYSYSYGYLLWLCHAAMLCYAAKYAMLCFICIFIMSRQTDQGRPWRQAIRKVLRMEMQLQLCRRSKATCWRRCRQNGRRRILGREMVVLRFMIWSDDWLMTHHHDSVRLGLLSRSSRSRLDYLLTCSSFLNQSLHCTELNWPRFAVTRTKTLLMMRPWMSMLASTD